jgi:hypothetical protein
LAEGVDHGGYLISSSQGPLRGTLVVKKHIVNQRLEVAAPFYQSCNWVVHFFLPNASPVTLSIGQTHTIYPKCEMNTGTVLGETDASLFSDNTSVASISSSGESRLITALAPS